MADKTKIEWTRGDNGSPGATWNPVSGCTKISSGCDNCYAETFAERWRGTKGHHFENGFDVQLRPDKLDQPLRWKKPRKIFVNSLSDLFHDKVPADFIAQVFGIMAAASRHTFQLLTKRHGRLRSLLTEPDFAEIAYEHARAYGCAKYDPQGGQQNFWPLPNVWVGVSVENQKWADIRIPALLETPAGVRWISAEPLLGPLVLADHWLGTDPYRRDEPSLDWVVVGGESGRRARPMHPSWPKDLRDQCQDATVAYYFKQWGEWRPQPRYSTDDRHHLIMTNGMDRGTPWSGWGLDQPDAEVMERVGKNRAGRELEGRTWDEFPSASALVGSGS